MPIAILKQCTAMVARRTAPAKGLFDATRRSPRKITLEVGVASEVRNGSNPRHTGSQGKLELKADLSSAYEKGARNNAPPSGSPRLHQPRKLLGQTGHYEGDPPVSRFRPHEMPRVTPQLPHDFEPNHATRALCMGLGLAHGNYAARKCSACPPQHTLAHRLLTNATPECPSHATKMH